MEAARAVDEPTALPSWPFVGRHEEVARIAAARAAGAPGVAILAGRWASRASPGRARRWEAGHAERGGEALGEMRATATALRTDTHDDERVDDLAALGIDGQPAVPSAAGFVVD